MLNERACGLLLHPTSLAGPFGIGDLGPTARSFVDFLRRAGQSYWQTLPLGPTGYGESPYSALSAFAGNPLLISPEELVTAGDLDAPDLSPWRKKIAVTDFAWARTCRDQLLKKAGRRFFQAATDKRRTSYDHFCKQQAFWLHDYAIFQSLREENDHRCWTEWPMELRQRCPDALTRYRQQRSEMVQLQRYQQFVFFEQWQRLKSYADRQGVRIFGDMPIFVAQDSSDTWSNRRLFHLDSGGQPEQVAGVPADYFSETGQRWGNPLFNWETMEEEKFTWWVQRMTHNLEMFDLLRVDHFRGFSSCWAIPVAAATALEGEWMAAPGERLFQRLHQALKELPLVAEDLGVMTDDVANLRNKWHLPGMNILQFAFDSDEHNPYLPQNHQRNSVVYTGTHDNNTSLGWWQELDDSARDRVSKTLGLSCPQMPEDLIRCALHSAARLCIIPAQDLLKLPASDRMNRPGKQGRNWIWRLPDQALTSERAAWLKGACLSANRLAACV